MPHAGDSEARGRRWESGERVLKDLDLAWSLDQDTPLSLLRDVKYIYIYTYI